MNPHHTSEDSIANAAPFALGPQSIIDESASTDSSAAIPRKARQVLHLINGEHFSGAERVQDLLAQGLPSFHYQLAFACLKADSFPEFRQSKTPLVDLEMKSKFDLRVVKQACQYAESMDACLIHAHTPRSAMIGARVARRLDLPFVYHVHSPTSRDSTRWLANRVNQWVEQRAMNRASALITVSASLKGHMISQGADPENVFVVTNGVAAREPSPRTSPNESWTLGTVALFRPRKGTEVLLEALAKLKSKGLPVKLLAVGGFETSEYEQSLMQRTSELGIESLVEWTGFCEDVNQQWDRMDAMVLPSLFGEGLPMVVLEAMASGVPVVAAAVEGVPEAIRDNRDGLLVQPGDANDLAERLEQLVTGKFSWSELRSSALNRQRQSFSTESMAGGTAAVYDQLLNNQA